MSNNQVRNIPVKYGIKYKQSKTTLGNRLDPESNLKKKIKGLEYNRLPFYSVLLFEDEKGPLVANTYKGNSWFYIRSKTSKAQKIKGTLNVFVKKDTGRHKNEEQCNVCSSYL
jgi:hypothetical protein